MLTSIHIRDTTALQAYVRNGDRALPVVTIPRASLSAEILAVISAAEAWLASQLDAGETPTQIIIDHAGTTADQTVTDEDGNPEYGPTRNVLSASVTGVNAAGERTIAISSEQAPTEIRDGLIAVWAGLESGMS